MEKGGQDEKRRERSLIVRRGERETKGKMKMNK